MQEDETRRELVPLAEAALPVSTARADHYARASRADRTWKQYASAFRQFEAWCAERGHCPLPASVAAVREYAAWLDHGRFQDFRFIALHDVAAA